MVEVFRLFLEIKSSKKLKEVRNPKIDCEIKLINPPDFQLNKFFYKQIGKDHKWTDRLNWNDQIWINYISNSDVSTHILKDNGELAGYYEQINNKETNNTEIAYFGILSEFRNKKYGGYLLSHAIKSAFKNGSKRIWVHTCSLDHKNALKNYISRGMEIFKEEKIKIPA